MAIVATRRDVTGVFRCDLVALHAAVAAFFANALAETAGISIMAADSARLRGMRAAVAVDYPLHAPATPLRDGQDGEKSGNFAASSGSIEPQCRGPVTFCGDIATFAHGGRRKKRRRRSAE